MPGATDIIQSTAMKVPFGAGGTSDSVDAAILAFIVEFNKHRGEADYFHPSLANAVAASTVAAPAATFLVRRDASGGFQSTAQVINALLNANGRTVNLPSGLQVASYNVDQILSNGVQVYGVDQYGNLTLAGLLAALGAALTGTAATNAASVLGIKAPPTPSADIAYVANNSGGTKYWSVNAAGNVVAPNGIWASAGTQLLDGKGNLATPRNNNEFLPTLSPSALTAQSAAGRYGDINGLGVVMAPTTVTATAHATLYVWWTWSYGVAGATHFAANTAGGNTVSASATKANFPTGDKRIGYILVPPAVTSLATATFDDWRNTEVGDGNAGAGGGAPADRSYITNVTEVANGLPNAVTLATALATAAASIKPVATAASLLTLTAGYVAPNLLLNPQGVLALSSSAVSIAQACGLEITGEYRATTGTPTITSNTASGLTDGTIVNLYAERGGAFAALATFGLVLSASAATATQRLLARYVWRSGALRPRLDATPLYYPSSNSVSLDYLTASNTTTTLISASASGTQTFATLTDDWPKASRLKLGGSWALTGAPTGATSVQGVWLLDGVPAGFQFSRLIAAGADPTETRPLSPRIIPVGTGAHTIALSLWILSGSTTQVSHTFTEMFVETWAV